MIISLFQLLGNSCWSSFLWKDQQSRTFLCLCPSRKVTKQDSVTELFYKSWLIDWTSASWRQSLPTWATLMCQTQAPPLKIPRYPHLFRAIFRTGKRRMWAITRWKWKSNISSIVLQGSQATLIEFLSVLRMADVALTNIAMEIIQNIGNSKCGIAAYSIN